MPRECTRGRRQSRTVRAGTLSTRADEFGIAFAPDGKTAWFTKRSPTTYAPPRSIVRMTRFVDEHWIEPEVATFSVIWNDVGTAVTSFWEHGGMTHENGQRFRRMITLMAARRKSWAASLLASSRADALVYRR